LLETENADLIWSLISGIIPDILKNESGFQELAEKQANRGYKRKKQQMSIESSEAGRELIAILNLLKNQIQVEHAVKQVPIVPKISELCQSLMKLIRERKEYLEGDKEEIEESCVKAFDIEIKEMRNQLNKALEDHKSNE
jgi:hypothetical protein